MPNGIQITLAGNVATTPKLRTVPRGAVADFRLASTRRHYQPGQGWTSGATSFVTITCWRGLAEHACASLQKGDPVVVTGWLSVREREVDGRTLREVEVTADALGHDLTFGTSMFRRATRVSGAREQDEATMGPTTGSAILQPSDPVEEPLPAAATLLPEEISGGLPQAVTADLQPDPAAERAA